jgi:hypothetical protein
MGANSACRTVGHCYSGAHGDWVGGTDPSHPGSQATGALQLELVHGAGITATLLLHSVKSGDTDGSWG